jgi:hypothetical protein
MTWPAQVREAGRPAAAAQPAETITTIFPLVTPFGMIHSYVRAANFEVRNAFEQFHRDH